jgi:hypothetical protein
LIIPNYSIGFLFCQYFFKNIFLLTIYILYVMITIYNFIMGGYTMILRNIKTGRKIYVNKWNIVLHTIFYISFFTIIVLFFILAVKYGLVNLTDF